MSSKTIIQCLNNLIQENNQYWLKPMILEAILNLYSNGNNRISAENVKNKCCDLNPEINWAQRIPAICNSMRKCHQYCEAQIIGENRDHNLFTIEFRLENVG